ncbi:MFS transporter [Ilyobacter polytropus]|uniref:Major facilitator superfamily MFS_1 n=1 Tax=Ilyobacter polytropus (strain ATCC 51220 / DSM 2926 / LMG 16218 / CuHBu1) TaxID=572544 RepID=E3HE47_ILYPC|nr:MFS transporter [Ilyobacter polytropus]ADO84659.1 major facilitator superfamily MFS_1 [Ilyobacter polytropus DSM 2926]
MKTNNTSRYFQFLLVVLAAGMIFALMYLRTNYQVTMIEVFGITNEQLNTIYSTLGLVYVIGYFPSGWLADKISAKKLLVGSLFGSGLGGLWYAQIPSYTSVKIIFAIWGFFSVFTFWGAHLKIVKLMSTKEEEGRFFGILDGGRGVVEALLASIGLALFSSILGESSDIVLKREALVKVIYMYTFSLFALSILMAIFLKDNKSNVEKEEKKNSLKRNLIDDFKSVFSNGFVWNLGIIIFMGYTVFWTVYYVGGFLQTNIEVDPVTVGLVTTIILWMRPVGGICGGFIADKIGKAKTLKMAVGFASVLLIGISVLPYTTPKIVFFALFILLAIMLYAIRGLYWSLLGDCRLNNAILGLSIGVISFIGYLPDMIIPKVNSVLFGTFGGNGGYNSYFITSAICGFIGVIAITIFRKKSIQTKEVLEDLQYSTEDQ